MRVIGLDSVMFKDLNAGDPFRSSLRTFLLVKTGQAGTAVALESGELLNSISDNEICKPVRGTFFEYRGATYHCDCCEYGGHDLV